MLPYCTVRVLRMMHSESHLRLLHSHTLLILPEPEELTINVVVFLCFRLLRLWDGICHLAGARGKYQKSIRAPLYISPTGIEPGTENTENFSEKALNREKRRHLQNDLIFAILIII
jgi:hypothetical protein